MLHLSKSPTGGLPHPCVSVSAGLSLDLAGLTVLAGLPPGDGVPSRKLTARQPAAEPAVPAAHWGKSHWERPHLGHVGPRKPEGGRLGRACPACPSPSPVPGIATTCSGWLFALGNWTQAMGLCGTSSFFFFFLELVLEPPVLTLYHLMGCGSPLHTHGASQTPPRGQGREAGGKSSLGAGAGAGE